MSAHRRTSRAGTVATIIVASLITLAAGVALYSSAWILALLVMILGVTIIVVVGIK